MQLPTQQLEGTSLSQQKSNMPIQKIQFQPGFDKQNTEITAKGKWIDGDKARFRY